MHKMGFTFYSRIILLLLNHDETLINSKFIMFINSLKLLWDSIMYIIAQRIKQTTSWEKN